MASAQHRERRRLRARSMARQARASRVRQSWAPRPKPDPIRNDAYRAAVEGLTNWQRGRWARSGYPGHRDREAALVEPFAALKRRMMA